MNNARTLLPHHLAELRASSIPADLINASGIASITHEEAYEFGFRSSGSLEGMFIPYLDPRTSRHSERYARLKPAIAIEEAKYLSPVAESPRFYFTPGTSSQDLSDSTVEICLVEGEKKALSVLGWAHRRGVRCIVVGLGGCYAWLRPRKGELPDGSFGKVGSDPIEDFELVNWQFRVVTIALDGDVSTNLRVAWAEMQLVKELRKRGARIRVIRIPAGKDGRRRGADDVIAEEGDDAWEAIFSLATVVQDAESDISDLLRDSGIGDLGEHPALERVEEVLTTLRQSLCGCSPLRRSLVREGAVEALKSSGLSSPAAIVDAALGKADPAEVRDLKGNSIAFVDPEPWDQPVDGAILLREISATYELYLVLPPGGNDLLSLWTMHAHAHDAAQVSPLLGIKSPTKRSGKTTAFSLIGSLVPKALHAANVTAATLFRAVDAYHMTLLADEADTFLPGNEELRGILNSGHVRSGATVIRTVGDNHEPRCFSTWSPKAIALIGELPGTLEDRSVVLSMRRKSKEEKVKRLRLDRLQEFEPLRRQACRWAKDNLELLRQADPVVPDALNDRAADNWRSLLAIADLAGGDWPERARQAALLISGASDEGENTPRILVLADLRALFKSRGVDRLPSKEVVAVFQEMEDRPWPEWKKGKPLSENQLARLLKPFDVKPKTIRLKDGTTPRGYLLVDLEDPFSRYLPSEVQHPQQFNQDAGSGDLTECNIDPPVAHPEIAENPRQVDIVAPVALPKQQVAAEPQGALPLEPSGPPNWEEI